MFNEIFWVVLYSNKGKVKKMMKTYVSKLIGSTWPVRLPLCLGALIVSAIISSPVLSGGNSSHCDNSACEEAIAVETAPVPVAEAAKASAVENPDIIEPGDFVVVNYTLRLKSGELILTSSAELAQDASVKKVAWFINPENYGPEQIIAERETRTPELSLAVLGMTANQKKSVPILPESGFGPIDPKRIKVYPLSKRVPRKMDVTAEEFTTQFKKFPVIGQEVTLTPYYTSKVTAISEKTVTLEARVEKNKVVPGDFGDTLVVLDGNDLVMTLSPKIGAPFTVMGQNGVITSADNGSFTVDFNHPGAGKALVMEVEVLSYQKASAFNAKELAWITDQDKGFKVAARKNKPVVLVLYAEWCTWSKRLLNETIKDPRIQAHWSDFVWVKVDSDKNKAYHEQYEQTGYPLVVLLDDHGQVVKKLDGFQDARALLGELNQCLHRSQG